MVCARHTMMSDISVGPTTDAQSDRPKDGKGEGPRRSARRGKHIDVSFVPLAAVRRPERSARVGPHHQPCMHDSPPSSSAVALRQSHEAPLIDHVKVGGRTARGSGSPRVCALVGVADSPTLLFLLTFFSRIIGAQIICFQFLPRDKQYHCSWADCCRSFC
jgi:hypothetical protein